ncbi:MAG TPA: NAD(P)-dependent oxidoreductase [Acidimicrobiales bacterium]|nr:NAD(P)-dependent oxidoreductase [Acidimicrobiales bacterium]
MSRLTVTGAGGYLGGAVAAAAGDVRCVVRRPTAGLPGETCVIGDLQVEASRALAGSRAVVHLAAPNEVRTAADPRRAVAEATGTARAVAAACAALGVKRLVYVSTVHVYGAALAPGAVVDETTRPQPRQPYATARLASEEAIVGAAGDCEVVVLRLTNAVGPPPRPSVDRWTLVANDLCRQAAREATLRLRSSGLQWRDFIALPDVTRAVLAAADGLIRPGTFNLGSGVSVTVLDLAGMVADAAAHIGLPRPEVIRGTEGPAEAAPPFQVSVARLREEGFGPGASLEQALQETIDFCRRHAG